MANDLTTNPWRIDTAAAGLIVLGSIFIKGMRWVAPGAAAGNACIVQDTNSKTKWESVAAGPNHVEADEVEDVIRPRSRSSQYLPQRWL